MAAGDDDAALMLRVGQGDREAFAEIFDRHQEGVVRFAYRFVGSRARAEEVAQEVFFKLYRAAPSYRPTAKFWRARIQCRVRWITPLARCSCAGVNSLRCQREPTSCRNGTIKRSMVAEAPS